MWSITLPGSTPQIIVYDNTSILNNVDNLAESISTMLTQYSGDEYIESILLLTVLMNVTLNDSSVQCSNTDQDEKSTKVFVNASGN